MAHKSLIVHGSWLAAVVAAFVLGGMRNSPESDPANAAGATPPTKVMRTGAGMGPAADPDGHFPSSRALRRNAKDGSAIAGGGRSWKELALKASRDSDPITRRLAFTRLLESMTADNVLAIREELVAAGVNGEQWRDFAYRWGALGGQEAVEMAATTPERDMNAALAGWAAADPTAAMNLLENLPENLQGSRDSLTASVVEGLSHHDPSMATDLVLRLAAEGNRKGEELIGVVAREAIRAGGYQDAAKWSESLPDGPLKAAAMDRVAGTFVRNDPEGAAEWAQGFATEDYAARVIEEVGDGWARRDPVAASDWLQDLPPGREQTTGLQSVFGDWEDRDPVAAGEYLMNMPQSAQRDSAISGFSRGYAWQDPQTAIAWAEDISDPRLRQETLTRAGQAFFRRDPESARNWLANANLPEEAQKAIQNPPRRR